METRHARDAFHCRNTGKATRTVTEKVKAILDHQDMKATTHAYAAVRRLTSARMLCGEAKTDAALSTYEQLRRMLDRDPPVRNAP
jgi:hypothetical protein